MSLLSRLALLAAALATPAAAQDAAHGASLFAQACLLCHQPTGANGQGPGLAGIVGRRAGSAPFGYSSALANAGFTWDPTRLERYLAAPAALVPGTSMAANVADAADRRAIVAYLATLAPASAATRPAPAASAAVQATPGAPSTGTPSTGTPSTGTPSTGTPSTGTPSTGTPSTGTTLTGPAAMGDWRRDAPGVRRRITLADLPPPYATSSSGNPPRIVPRPAGAVPQAPTGFEVTLFASGLENPRAIRVAPDGAVFVAESAPGRIRLLRPGAPPITFIDGLSGPFGIAFYPPGPDPRWIYVAETNAVRRYPYTPGAPRPGAPETIVARLAPTAGGHVTRDIAFTPASAPGGTRMLVSVGSQSNVAQSLPRRTPDAIRAWEATHGLGALWDNEENRAAILSFTPDGKDARIYATGLRNCVGLAIQPGTDLPWCSTNERDGLGDDLVPDYVTRVREGAFYGWPWYWLGDNEDPRLVGHRPDLRGRVTTPDVLLQPHSASLQMAFHTHPAFPKAWQGAYAAEHGSWNRDKRTGYKLIRIPLDAAGNPTGEYEDFLTGFVLDDRTVWGRPVGVAVTNDGALLVSEDGNGTIWQVTRR